ncbi:hypothetical protein [Massilia sp. NR 4-1]|uniref:hypothetical protein n=1 Tax=Massilia sp. NR 4-1 TaxID=1678028 RepID=UPI0012374EFC|nr:hypothetical protein [Massilia sp. NR 4-1]
MNHRNIARALGHGLLHIIWPWGAIKNSLKHFRSAKDSHAKNLVYIRDLYRQSQNKIGREEIAPSYDHHISFEDALTSHPEPEQHLAHLKRYYLLQKRLMLATGIVVCVASVCAIANGDWLAIATILSSVPLFLMGSFSSTFRLWQLRSRRLSRQEHGGVEDFIRDNPNWVAQILNPEFTTRFGE